MSYSELVGVYEYAKGGSMEKYSQELTIRADKTGFYKESGETKYEQWTRSGEGKWKVDNDTFWIVCDSLTKDTKVKKQLVPFPGYKDEIKVDYNIAVDIPLQKLQTAPPAGPNAPKNRWNKRQ